MVGDYGNYTCNDGLSRQFDPASTDPRVIIATGLARRDGWAEIRPSAWATAGAVVKELKGKGLLLDRRARRKAA